MTLVRIFSLALISTFALFPSANAKTFTVNSTEDAVDLLPGDGTCDSGGGLCTLRAAILESNALNGSDIILLQPASTYTLTRAGQGDDSGLVGDLDISQSLEIRGAGPESTIINAAGLDRALDVISTVGVKIQDLTIRGGSVNSSGGGVRNRGFLILTRLSIEENSALGGGAIFNNGALFVDRCAIVNNSGAVRGGGILNRRLIETDITETVIVNSTLTLNSTYGSGGAIANEAFSYLAVIHSTIVNNSADVSPQSTSITLPPTGDGGGVFHEPGAEFVITNSIVALNRDLNRSGVEPATPDCSGVYDEISNSIFTQFQGCSSPNEIGVLKETDPGIQLVEKGVGRLAHFSLLSSSPAIDRADSEDCPPTDQREELRPRDGNSDGSALCDIGSVELVIDCNGNAISDDLDLSEGRSRDVNTNYVPDECDPDSDADTIPDDVDNCVALSNPLQENADGDEYGDVCEPDSDGDGLIDDFDLCPRDPKKEKPLLCGCGLPEPTIMTDITDKGTLCVVKPADEMKVEVITALRLLQEISISPSVRSDSLVITSLLGEIRSKAKTEGFSKVARLMNRGLKQIKKALLRNPEGSGKFWTRAQKTLNKALVSLSS